MHDLYPVYGNQVDDFSFITCLEIETSSPQDVLL